MTNSNIQTLKELDAAECYRSVFETRQTNEQCELFVP